MRELFDQHIGKWWRRINVQATNIDVIGDSAADIQSRMDALAADIEAAIARHFPVREQRLPDPDIVDAYGEAKEILTREQQKAVDDKHWDDLREMFAASQAALDAEMAAHPNNGTLGYWNVVGIRHDAIVRADSAPAAIRKAIECGEVGDWESPRAHWLGVETPACLAPAADVARA